LTAKLIGDVLLPVGTISTLAIKLGTNIGIYCLGYKILYNFTFTVWHLVLTGVIF